MKSQFNINNSTFSIMTICNVTYTTNVTRQNYPSEWSFRALLSKEGIGLCNPRHSSTKQLDLIAIYSIHVQSPNWVALQESYILTRGCNHPSLWKVRKIQATTKLVKYVIYTSSKIQCLKKYAYVSYTGTGAKLKLQKWTTFI